MRRSGTRKNQFDTSKGVGELKRSYFIVYVNKCTEYIRLHLSPITTYTFHEECTPQ